MVRDRNVLVGTLAAVTAAILFGTLGPLARYGADAGVPGVAFTAWRALLGAAFLVTLIVARGAMAGTLGSLRALPARGQAALATAALAGLALNSAFFTAIGLIPIALVLMLFYAYPAGVAVVDLLLGRERATASRLVALGLSSMGMVLVLAGSMDTTAGVGLDPVGILLGLVAAASQVVFVTVSRDGYRSVPADAATLVILATAAAGASVLAVVTGLADGLIAPLSSPEPWPSLLVAGVLAAGVSSLLFLTAIRRIGGTRTGILMLLEPVVGVFLAGLLLAETLTALQFLGGAFVLAGALVLQVRSDPGREPVVEAGAGPVV